MRFGERGRLGAIRTLQQGERLPSNRQALRNKDAQSATTAVQADWRYMQIPADAHYRDPIGRTVSEEMHRTHQDGFGSPTFSRHLRTPSSTSLQTARDVRALELSSQESYGVLLSLSGCSRVASLAVTEVRPGLVLADGPQSCLPAGEKKGIHV